MIYVNNKSMAFYKDIDLGEPPVTRKSIKTKRIRIRRHYSKWYRRHVHILEMHVQRLDLEGLRRC